MRVRRRGVAEGGRWGWFRITICNLWSILAEVAGVRGKLARPLCLPPAPTFLSQQPPPCPRGGLLSPEGRTCCRARQTIFRLTAFTFSLTRASWKQTDKTKDSKLMTHALHSPPQHQTQPLTIKSKLGTSNPPLPYTPYPATPPWPDFWSHITHTPTHSQCSHTYTHHHINLFLNSLTRSIWFRLSQEERDRDIQRKRVSVCERKGLSVCVWAFIIMC